MDLAATSLLLEFEAQSQVKNKHPLGMLSLESFHVDARGIQDSAGHKAL